MFFTKSSAVGFFVSGVGFATTVGGWITSINPVAITGLIAACLGGFIASLGAYKRQRIEIGKIEAQADAEKIALYRKDCEDRARALEIKCDSQQTEISKLQVELARWETRHPKQSPASTLEGTK